MGAVIQMSSSPSVHTSVRQFLRVFIVLLLLGGAAQSQSASEILTKVTKVYASCRSYSDEGSGDMVSIQLTRHSTFRTSFVRDTGFQYRVWLMDRADSGPWSPWVVWKSGDQLKLQGIATPAQVQNLGFDSALSRMSVFSAGSSVAIPPLLMPAEFRFSDLISLIGNPVLAGEERIDGRRTFRVEGVLQGFPIKLWIDQAQYLILKSYRKVNIGDQWQEITVQYNPRIDVPIPPEDLVFTAPATVSKDAPIAGSPPTTNSLLPPRLKSFGSSLGTSPKQSEGLKRAADNEDVVRVVTDLVVSPVLVLDAQGKNVRGLTAEDFIVKEDDRLQKVATFLLGDNKDVARAIVLILDYSHSQLPYINTSVESAKTLVDKLSPKDRMAIVTDDVKLLVDFTSDKELLKTRLTELKTRALAGLQGASEQYDALLATLNELFDREEDARPIVIFQTDGDELELLKSGTEPYYFPRKYGLEDILTAAAKKRTTIFSVLSGVRFVNSAPAELLTRARRDFQNRQRAAAELYRAMNSRSTYVPPWTSAEPSEQVLTRQAEVWLRRQTALVALSTATGAPPEFLEEPGQADEIYNRILSNVDQSYVIGYYPTNRVHDGKRRKVSIEVRGHPEYVIWGQKSYFAREEK